MDMTLRGKAPNALVPPPHVPRFGKSHIEISIPQDPADAHAYPPEAVQVRNTFIHVASPGQGAEEEIVKNAVSCPASHVGWIQKLFTEEEVEACQAPKEKPVISLEETLIFDVPNTPQEEPTRATAYAARESGKQWLATQPPQQPVPPVHDAGLCPPRAPAPCEPSPCYGGEESYMPYRMYEEPWIPAPNPMAPMHDPQMCPPPHPVPCEPTPGFYHHAPPEQHQVPPMPIPCEHPHGFYHAPPEQHQAPPMPIPCEPPHGFYPPPMHDPHMCPHPHPVPCDPPTAFYHPVPEHAPPMPMPCEPRPGFYHPPPEEPRPMMPVPCEPRPGFYHPPPGPMMPVPCEPTPGFYHPPPLPAPCEPTPGFYHPHPEEPHRPMMQVPCETTPGFYHPHPEEPRNLTMPAPRDPGFYPPRPDEPRGPLATYPQEDPCRRDWRMPEAQPVRQEEPPANAKIGVEDLPPCPPSIQVPSAPAPGSAELPSIGSDGHKTGECRPCAFLYAKGCQNGAMCLFCHLCDKGEKKRRQKAKKASFQGGA
ncbi:unnamed protein product [Symbiodinium natans]|uniref:C3H1-type domain-containing protein n=1 Tax=Symbiodinium natans TaxID=878477 RepID=A0A812T7A5_9DINO|nr:unnamed protein product [Symbiodinium natans]